MKDWTILINGRLEIRSHEFKSDSFLTASTYARAFASKNAIFSYKVIESYKIDKYYYQHGTWKLINNRFELYYDDTEDNKEIERSSKKVRKNHKEHSFKRKK